RVLAERQPRVIFEGHFQPCGCTGRHGLVENNRRVEAERPCSAAKHSARLSLYAADRADRIPGRDLITGEARKKRHRNDDQLTQPMPARPKYHQTDSDITRARAQCRVCCLTPKADSCTATHCASIRLLRLAPTGLAEQAIRLSRKDWPFGVSRAVVLVSSTRR